MRIFLQLKKKDTFSILAPPANKLKTWINLKNSYLGILRNKRDMERKPRIQLRRYNRKDSQINPLS